MNKKQLIINIFSNIFSFCVGIGINFFLTPFLIESIGKEVYGFIPLIGNFISYTTIFATALNSMAGRFISIKINQKDYKNANIYFNTVLFSNIILSLLIGIIFLLMTIYLEDIINIPINLIKNIKVLFALTFGGAIISLIFSVYSVTTFCTNRMDIKAYINIGETIVRVVSLMCLFLFFKPNVIFIGITTVLMSIFTCYSNYLCTKRYLPYLKLNYQLFDLKVVKLLIGSGMWNAFNQLSSILLTGLDLLLTNLFIGISEAGVLGIVKVIPNLLYSFAAIFSNVFSPQLTILYAKNDINSLVKEIQFSLKIMGVIVGIPIAGFIGFGDIFYSLWVPGEDEILLHTLSILTLLGSLISCSTLTLNNIYIVTNKLKAPAIILFISSILSTIIVILLLMYTDLGIFAIVSVSSFISIIRNLLFDTIYSSYCLNLKWNTFYPYIIKSLISMGLIVFICQVVRNYMIIDDWISLIIAASISSILALIVNGFIILNNSDRKKILIIINRNK